MHKTGSLAGFVAVVAVFLHMEFAPQSETVTGTEKGASTATVQKAAGQHTPDEADEAVEGPWLATRNYFVSQGNRLKPSDVSTYLQQVPTPSDKPVIADGLSKFLGLDRVPDKTNMWSIVATVPDPLHTHMALLLDGQIEAIERSLQAANWEFAGQWLPWSDRFDGSEPDINARRKQRRLQAEEEAMPGILIFRSGLSGLPARRLLFVLLVPETATSGINGRAFFAALNLAAVLTTPPNYIGLLAPTFSGSFASLTERIKDWQRVHPASRLAGVVYSAFVSDSVYANSFKAATGLSFHAGGLDTHDYQQVFCAVLKKYNLRDQAALLKEDESRYSSSFMSPLKSDPAERPKPDTAGCSVEAYVFPRDISRLRNAYQDGKPASRDPYLDPSWNLDFSIRDPDTGEDSIPIFSEVQTPLTQDATISSIVRELHQDGIKIVSIAAANSLDTLFLMRALRREAPDIRILVENPNILLVPAASRDPFSGSIVLSPYPLFQNGEKWLDGNPSPDKIRFPDPQAEGIYNVTQFLLHDLGALQNPQLISYRQFAGGHAYPGMWVLTLNRGGFLPLDYESDQDPLKSWTSTPSCGRKEDCGWLRQNPDQKLPDFPNSIVPPRSWWITVFAANAAILLACGLLLLCNLSTAARHPYWLALTEGLQIRLPALLGVTLSLTALEWILISPELFPPSQLFSDASGWLPLGSIYGVFAVLALVAPILTLAVVGIPKIKHQTLAGLLSGRQLLYPVFMLVTFLTVTGGWAWSCYFSDGRGFFLRFRSVDLYSGSSPATPLILLAGAIFIIAWSYFKRYTMAGGGRPRFEFAEMQGDSGAVRAFANKLWDATQAFERSVLAPSGLSFWAGFWRIGMGIVLVAVCLRVLGTYPSALESREYNAALWMELVVVLYWFTIGCYDFTELWSRLRAVLNLIELFRLQPAIKRVAREWPRRPVWAFRRADSKHPIKRQMLYALHGRMVVRKGLEKQSLSTAVAAASVGSFSRATVSSDLNVASAKTADAQFKRFQKAVNANSISSTKTASPAEKIRRLEYFQKTSTAIAAEILNQDLRPWWRESLEGEDASAPRDEREQQKSVYLKCCEDFVALQACRYLAYCVEHIQRIIYCISITFVSLLIFFNSYSPQGPQTIARFLAVVFLLMGYLVIRVLAQMERNPILSRMSRTNPGELNADFWVQLITIGGLPLLGVLAHLFPALSQFLFQWVAPSVQAAR